MKYRITHYGDGEQYKGAEMTDEMELEPCPFCGSDGQIVSSSLLSKTKWEYKMYAPQCSGNKLSEDSKYGCPAANWEQDEQGGYACEAHAEREAIELWNARCGEAALLARAERDEAMIKSADEKLENAGNKVGLNFGCDNAEVMADTILEYQNALARAKTMVERLIEAGNVVKSYADTSTFSERYVATKVAKYKWDELVSEWQATNPSERPMSPKESER
jgi:ssDNA-binding Zn-finger/Zn-ribbon topoisomerase 1